MMRFFLLSLALSSAAAFAPALQQASRTTQGVANTPLFRNSKVSSTERSAVMEQAELPSKLYFTKTKETPKVLGGLKIGLRELVVVTGASSGLGLNCAATLAKTGKYFVVMAVRDIEKAKRGKFQIHCPIHLGPPAYSVTNLIGGPFPSIHSCQGIRHARWILCRHEA